MGNSLTEILKDEPSQSTPAAADSGATIGAGSAEPAKTEGAAVATAVAKPVDAKTDASLGKSTGDTTAPPAAKSHPTEIPVTALLDEREKRQAAERRARALEQQLAASRPAQQRPDERADPEGARQYDQQQQEQRFINERVNQSWELCRSTVTDFDKVMEEWPKVHAAEPYLVALSYEHPNPALFIYREVKKRSVLGTVGDDLSAYEKKLYAKWEAERAAQAGQPGATAAPAVQPLPAPPPSLANEQSAGPRTPTHASGRTPLTEILPPINERKRKRA